MISTQELALALSNSKVKYNTASIARRVVINATLSTGDTQAVYARGNRNAKLYIALDYVKLHTINYDLQGVTIRLKRVAKLYNKNVVLSSGGVVKVVKTSQRSKLVHTTARVYEEVTEFTTVATYDDITTALVAIVK